MATRSLTYAEMDAVEALVDATSLRSVVEALAVIAQDKSLHIEETWQDAGLARLWQKEADKLNAVAAKLKPF